MDTGAPSSLNPINDTLKPQELKSRDIFLRSKSEKLKINTQVKYRCLKILGTSHLCIW